MDEFDLIKHYFAPLTAKEAFNLLDDAAMLASLPQGEQWVITQDAMTEHVHFLSDTDPYDLSRKLLRVNISDLAAMGAKPYGYLLTLILPKDTTEKWIQAFAAGLAIDQKQYSLHLLGGDTVSQHSTISLSLTAIGSVATPNILRRSNAQVGDAIYVSGTIGDAALGLQALQGKFPFLKQAQQMDIIDRYHLPQPRVMLGQHLGSIAHAAIDISDGLIQDCEHLCKTSSVGANIMIDAIPLSTAVQTIISLSGKNLLPTILSGGDDYELLFTAAPEKELQLEAIAKETGTPITQIGHITDEPGVRLIDSNKDILDIPMDNQGYKHF